MPHRSVCRQWNGCSPAQPPQHSQAKPHIPARGSDNSLVGTCLAQPFPQVQGVALGHTGEVTMSWLGLNGSADTELDTTTGKVFVLSPSRLVGSSPFTSTCCHGTLQTAVGRTKSINADTDHACQQVPACPVPWQTSAGLGEDSEGTAPHSS